MELCVAKNAQGQLHGWTQETKLAAEVISMSTESRFRVVLCPQRKLQLLGMCCLAQKGSKAQDPFQCNACVCPAARSSRDDQKGLTAPLVGFWLTHRELRA